MYLDSDVLNLIDIDDEARLIQTCTCYSGIPNLTMFKEEADQFINDRCKDKIEYNNKLKEMDPDSFYTGMYDHTGQKLTRENYIERLDEANRTVRSRSIVDYIYLTIISGDVKKVRWLWKTTDQWQNNITYIYDRSTIFNMCCRYGHLEMVEFLWEGFDGQIEIEDSYDPDWKLGQYSAIDEAARNNHLDIIKYLLKVKPNFNYHNWGEYTFRAALREGHYDICRYLHSHSPVNLYCIPHGFKTEKDWQEVYTADENDEEETGTINQEILHRHDHEEPFILYCSEGDIERAQFIYELSGRTIDIHRHDDMAFRLAKTDEIRSWLMSLN